MGVEAILLDLLGVLLGDKRPGRGGTSDRGLMFRTVHGFQHVPTCPHGQWLTEGGPRPHGDPCSARCLRAHAAISAASRWLQEHEQPAQIPLLLEVV